MAAAMRPVALSTAATLRALLKLTEQTSALVISNLLTITQIRH